MEVIKPIPAASPSKLQDPIPFGDNRTEADKIIGDVPGLPSQPQAASVMQPQVQPPIQQIQQQVPAQQRQPAAEVDDPELVALMAAANASRDASGNPVPPKEMAVKKLGFLQNLWARFKASFTRSEKGMAVDLKDTLVKQGYVGAETKVEGGEVKYRLDQNSDWNLFDEGAELADVVDWAGDVVEIGTESTVKYVGTVAGALAGNAPGMVAGYSAGTLAGAYLGNKMRDLGGLIAGTRIDDEDYAKEVLTDAALSAFGDVAGLALKGAYKSILKKPLEAAASNTILATTNFLKRKVVPEITDLRELAYLTEEFSKVAEEKYLSKVPTEEATTEISKKITGHIEEVSSSIGTLLKTTREIVAREAEKKGIPFSPQKTIDELKRISSDQLWDVSEDGLFNASKRIKQKRVLEEQGEDAYASLVKKQGKLPPPGPTESVLSEKDGINDLIEIMDFHDALVLAKKGGEKLDYTYFAKNVMGDFADRAKFGNVKKIETIGGVTSAMSAKPREEVARAFSLIYGEMKSDSLNFIGSAAGKDTLKLYEKALSDYVEVAAFRNDFSKMLSGNNGKEYVNHLLDSKNLDYYRRAVRFLGEESEPILNLKWALGHNLVNNMFDKGTGLFNPARFRGYYTKHMDVIKGIMPKEDINRIMTIQSAAEKLSISSSSEIEQVSAQRAVTDVLNIYRIASPIWVSKVGGFMGAIQGAAATIFLSTKDSVTAAEFAKNKLLPEFAEKHRSSSGNFAIFKIKDILSELHSMSDVVPKGIKSATKTAIEKAVPFKYGYKITDRTQKALDILQSGVNYKKVPKGYTATVKALKAGDDPRMYQSASMGVRALDGTGKEPDVSTSQVDQADQASYEKEFGVQ